MIKEEKIKEFVSRFPDIIHVAKKLNEASIKWMIGGSGCLFLLGNKRTPDDVDIFITDDEHDRVDEMFKIKSYTYTSAVESVRNSNFDGGHDIQFTSHVEFNLDKHYQYKITRPVLDKRISFDCNGTTVYLLPPEDPVLIKALLQRGVAEGKSDLEDIQKFTEVYRLDKDYLLERIRELGAENRVAGIF